MGCGAGGGSGVKQRYEVPEPTSNTAALPDGSPSSPESIRAQPSAKAKIRTPPRTPPLDGSSGHGKKSLVHISADSDWLHVCQGLAAEFEVRLTKYLSQGSGSAVSLSLVDGKIEDTLAEPPNCRVFVPIVTPGWLRAPYAQAELRAILRARAMGHAVPQLLPAVLDFAFGTAHGADEAVRKELSSPPALLLRHAASPAPWIRLDGDLVSGSAYITSRIETFLGARPMDNPSSYRHRGQYGQDGHNSNGDSRVEQSKPEMQGTNDAIPESSSAPATPRGRSGNFGSGNFAEVFKAFQRETTPPVPVGFPKLPERSREATPPPPLPGNCSPPKPFSDTMGSAQVSLESGSAQVSLESTLNGTDRLVSLESTLNDPLLASQFQKRDFGTSAANFGVSMAKESPRSVGVSTSPVEAPRYPGPLRPPGMPDLPKQQVHHFDVPSSPRIPSPSLAEHAKVLSNANTPRNSPRESPSPSRKNSNERIRFGSKGNLGLQPPAAAAAARKGVSPRPSPRGRSTSQDTPQPQMPNLPSKNSPTVPPGMPPMPPKLPAQKLHSETHHGGFDNFSHDDRSSVDRSSGGAFLPPGIDFDDLGSLSQTLSSTLKSSSSAPATPKGKSGKWSSIRDLFLELQAANLDFKNPSLAEGSGHWSMPSLVSHNPQALSSVPPFLPPLPKAPPAGRCMKENQQSSQDAAHDVQEAMGATGRTEQSAGERQGSEGSGTAFDEADASQAGPGRRRSKRPLQPPGMAPLPGADDPKENSMGSTLSSDLGRTVKNPFADGRWPEAKQELLKGRFGTYVLGAGFRTAGTRGTKMSAVEQTSGRPVTVWRMDLRAHGEQEKRLVENLTAEIEGTLRNIRHQHLCPIMGCELVAGTGLFVISGYAPGGSVADWLVDAGALAEPQIGRVIQASVLGLEYLHSQDVLHTGLRGSNVLLGPGTAVRLADFGCALRAGGPVDSLRRPWLAPELLAGGEPTEASDVWALGCLVVEMASGRTPWEKEAELADRTLEELLRQIATSTLDPPLPKNLSIPAQKFVFVCLKHAVGNRPSAKKLLQEAFLERVKESLK